MLRRCRIDYDGYRNNDGGRRRDDLRASRAAMALVIVNGSNRIRTFGFSLDDPM
jgi:hypothetical protein